MRCFLSICIGLVFLFSVHESVAQNQKISLPSNVTVNDYEKASLIIKVKPDIKVENTKGKYSIPALNQVLKQIGVVSLEKKFPNTSKPETKTNKFGQELVDLSTIFEIHFNAQIEITYAINLLLSTSALEYCQPHYFVKPLGYNPNDPLLSNQYHLNNIQAFDAWGLYKGDTNSVIGICDWGNDIDHPDLINAVKYNYNDPIDGIDNDNDGFVDNFRGWDLGENDNNPQGNITHGAFVSGLAAAKTDNGTGIAGAGFRCKYLPIKIADASNDGNKGYEGIVYAVEHGCSVINCSWGATFFTGPYGQDVVNYAVINKGALIVAACGNDNNLTPYYPAAYDNVLSVAATNQNDVKWSGSSYGYFVDIAAPGEMVWSTLDGGTYGPSSGTSFSAPIVSGCAAIIKSKFPELSGLQVGEKLKVSADVIDTITQNHNYKDLLGSGRVNLLRAMQDSVTPSLHCVKRIFSDKNNDGTFTACDTMLLKASFINYLHATSSGVKITVSSLSPFAKMLDSVYMPGTVAEMSTVINNNHPIKFYIKDSVPVNDELTFRIVYSDVNYRAVEYFTLMVNPNFITLDTNHIAVSFTNQGMIGFDRGNYFQGTGLRYKNGASLLSCGGLVVGTSNTKVSDVVYSSGEGYDMDFFTKKNMHFVPVSDMSCVAVEGEFNDSLAMTQKINVYIKQSAFAWNFPYNEDFILLKYVIKNKNLQPITGLYAGVYLDWDMSEEQYDRVDYNASKRFGYCYSTSGGAYAGIAAISSGQNYFYALDNDGALGSIKIDDGFTTAEKYTALKTQRYESGLSGNGNDVSGMMSYGPLTIGVNDSVEKYFVLLLGETLPALENTLDDVSQIMYHTDINENNIKNNLPVLFQNFPNPFTEETSIKIYIPEKSEIQLTISDISGKVRQTVCSGIFNTGFHNFDVHNLPAGIYVYELRYQGKVLHKKMCVIK